MPNTHTTLTGLFDDIADAIRSKTGGSADITADSFPDAIEDIPTGVPRTGLDITVSNGVAYIPAGLYRNNINRTVVQGSQTYTQNGTYDVRALAQAVVNVPQPSGKITITANGTDIDVSQYATADVSVSGGASSELAEHGTVSFHLGSNNYHLKIPVSDATYDNYLVYYKAVKSWLKVNDEWVEQSGLDFTGVTDAVSIAFCGYASTVSVNPTAMIDTDGTSRTIAAKYGQLARSAVTSAWNFIQVLYPSAVPTISGGVIDFNLGANNYICSKNYGLTYEYGLWGWNNA